MREGNDGAIIPALGCRSADRKLWGVRRHWACATTHEAECTLLPFSMARGFSRGKKWPPRFVDWSGGLC